MEYWKEFRLKAGLLFMGLVLLILPLVAFQGEGWAARLFFAMPGNGLCAAAILLFLTDFNRFRTHQRILLPLACVLLMVSGGMLCLNFALSRLELLFPAGLDWMFLMFGIALVVLPLFYLLGLIQGERERRESRKKSKKQRRKK